MSRKVATLVYSKQVGSMARKAVLAYFADRANDDGSGVWTAKQRIADEIECSKQTVITTVKAMLADGLIVESGHRPNGNGYTVEYAIDLVAVAALPDAKRDEEGVQNLTGQEIDGSSQFTPRGQAALPKPSLNRPLSQKATPSSRARAATAKVLHFRLPDDWKPSRFAEGTVAREIIDRRGQEWARAALESFRSWAANADDKNGAGRKLNWQAAWVKWVIEQDKRDGRTNGMAGSGQPAKRSSGVGLIDAIRESRANREAVPWDAGDTGGMQGFAGLG